MVKPLTIRVFGIGSAGCCAVDHMSRGDLRELAMTALHTNARTLESYTVQDRWLLGTRLTRGLGTGGDPELGKAVAVEESERLRSLCAGVDLVILVAGLGGGTGSGVTPHLARIAKESGALVLAMVSLPFEFEGARRQRQSQAGLHQIKAAADGVICLPNQKALQIVDENTSLVDTFRILNEWLAQGVRGIWQMLSQRGLIHVDFADLCAVLRGRHSESSFASAQAEGDGRAREVVEKLLANPLLESGQMLAEADALLISIVGGPDLVMAEVNRVMEQFNRLAENAQVVMGAAVTPEMTGLLKVTAIASRKAESAKEPPAESKPNALMPEPGGELGAAFFDSSSPQRPPSRFVAPAPELTPDRAEELLSKSATNGGRSRSGKAATRWRQGQLPLEVVSKGRFEKVEPTIHEGEDLDVPTYIRRGIPLN